MTVTVKDDGGTRAVVSVNGNPRLYVNADGSIEAVSPPAVASGNQLVSMGQSKLSRGVAQATTSGTFIDFTGIPSWVNRLTVSLSGVSTNGSSNIQVQLGTSSGVEAAGYNSAASYTNGAAINSTGSTSGVVASANINSSYSLSGVLTLTRLSANTWAAAGVTSSGVQVMPSSGIKVLAGALDRIRLTTVNGTDVFDAGSVNIMWE